MIGGDITIMLSRTKFDAKTKDRLSSTRNLGGRTVDGFASDTNNPSMTHLIIATEDPFLMKNPYSEDENKALTYQLSKF